MTYFLHFELCSLACFIKAHKSEKTATAVPEKALSRLLHLGNSLVSRQVKLPYSFVLCIPSLACGAHSPA